jgi:hypothetical protein
MSTGNVKKVGCTFVVEVVERARLKQRGVLCAGLGLDGRQQGSLGRQYQQWASRRRMRIADNNANADNEQARRINIARRLDAPITRVVGRARTLSIFDGKYLRMDTLTFSFEMFADPKPSGNQPTSTPT